jgi:glucose-6-phosphate isomerase
MSIKYQFEIGKNQKILSEALQKVSDDQLLKKMWQKDGSVWTDDPRHHIVAANRLGWLDLPSKMGCETEALEDFAESKAFRKLKHIVHLGMGGSSLAPEVFYKTIGNAADYPELIVLDSTDPDYVDDVLKRINPGMSLFIIASKSGTTVETHSLAEFFYERLVQADPESAANHFIAITDPGTALQKEGEQKYAKVFVNPSDIGGRYSALSYFGIVPFALLGRDLKRFLEKAKEEESKCGKNVPPETCDPVKLGALLGKLAEATQNKLTIQTSSSLSTVGWWIEQLVAESTGKEGKGILPVNGEELTAPAFYSSDRVFVYMKLHGDIELEKEEKLKILQSSGFPVVQIEIDNIYELGGLFYHWEVATAAAASIMRIDPFDEPNVQESKDNTKRVLNEFRSTGRIEFDAAPILDGEMRVYGNVATAGDVDGVLTNLFAGRKAGDYLAIMAYLPRLQKVDELLSRFQAELRDRLKIPVTVGYGPRFLHSTGQFHKGGTKNGLYLQFVHQPQKDLAIPGESYTFSNLFLAQAAGDYISLKSKDKPVVSIVLGGDFYKQLAGIVGKIK